MPLRLLNAAFTATTVPKLLFADLLLTMLWLVVPLPRREMSSSESLSPGNASKPLFPFLKKVMINYYDVNYFS